MTNPEDLRARAASIFRQLRGDDDDVDDAGRKVESPKPPAAEYASGPAPVDDATVIDLTNGPAPGSPGLLLNGRDPEQTPAGAAPSAAKAADDASLPPAGPFRSTPLSPGADATNGSADAPIASVEKAPVRGTPDPSAISGTADVPAPGGPSDAQARGRSSGPGDSLAADVVGPAPAAPAVDTWVATRRKLADLDVLAGTPASTARAPGSRHPSADKPLPRVLAIANQKGGVGKTTTAVNLGAGLAELGYRILVVDLDPQGNASTGLGVNARNLDASVYDVLLHDVPMDDVVEPTTLRNLFVAPATIDLAGAEVELVPAFSRELRLRRAVESVTEDFDYVIIDCPPSLGLLTVNGLAAATEVVVPIQCEYYALEGLSQLLRNVNLVRTNLNPALEVSTIVLTMYDARTRLAEQVVTEVRQHFGGRVCRNIVPRTVRLSEAPSFGQPIIVFDPSSRGAIAYRELAKEVSGGAPQRAR